MTPNDQEIRKFVLSLGARQPTTDPTPMPAHPTKSVLALADRLAVWHDTRPVPVRWQPVLLGRVAALFGVSRELAAAAMIHAGWTENRIGVGSWWTAPAFTQPPAERK